MMGLPDLPIELQQIIALQIPSDKDLCSFAAACRSSHDAVYRDGDSFWFQRFKLVYDPVLRSGLMSNNTSYKDLYQSRYKEMAIALSPRQMAKRGSNNSKWFKTHLKMLLRLIADANLSYKDTEGNMSSKNADILTRHAFDSGMLGEVFRADDQKSSENRLKLIQLILAHKMFELVGKAGNPLYDTHHFSSSQMVVYAATTGDYAQPVFHDPGKQQVNINFALHCVNFFKYHLTDRVEQTGWPEYSALPEKERPAAWQPQPEDEVGKLGNRWIGTYTYLEHHELQALRRLARGNSEADCTFQDKHIDEDTKVLQSMEISFVDDGQEHFYPKLFDRILDPKPQGTPAQQRQRINEGADQKFRFAGLGEDEEIFHTSGYITPLPPQNGVPGFCRVVMMKYFDCPLNGIARDSLWAYEGVVLPGGKMMVGRWWAADDGTRAADMYSGPFIFWNIPDESVEQSLAKVTTGAENLMDVAMTSTNWLGERFDGSHAEVANGGVEDTSSKVDGSRFSEPGNVRGKKDLLSMTPAYLSVPESSAKVNVRARNGTANAHTLLTPTTPFRGMSLDSPIDLTDDTDDTYRQSHYGCSGTDEGRCRVDSLVARGPDYSYHTDHTLGKASALVDPVGAYSRMEAWVKSQTQLHQVSTRREVHAARDKRPKQPSKVDGRHGRSKRARLSDI